MENLNKLIFDEAVKKGFEWCEIYTEKGNSFSVSIFQGEIYQYKNSYSNGISFRGLYNGNIGYSYSEKVDSSVVDLLLENALINSEIIEDEDKEEIFDGNDSYEEVNGYNPKLNDTTVDEKIDFAKTMEKVALEFDERVKSVNASAIGSGESEFFIKNSKGLDLTFKGNLCYAYIYVSVEENDVVKVAGEKWLANDFSEFDAKELAEKAVLKALSQLGAESMPSANLPVLIENEAMCDLLTAFEGAFYAESVQKGFSKLKGKIGDKIGSDILTIRDDGILEGSINSIPFDSEGVATKNKVIIENGVLKTFLHNMKTAKKDNVEYTGNGFKSSFKSSIGISSTNFYIKPLDIKVEDVISKLDRSVKITEFQGLHSGTNGISGDFSLFASGFLIENGKIIKPIEQITIAGNFFELLENITEICDDLIFDFPNGNSMIGAPSVLVSELSIGGM